MADFELEHAFEKVSTSSENDEVEKVKGIEEVEKVEEIDNIEELQDLGEKDEEWEAKVNSLREIADLIPNTKCIY